MKPQTMHCHLLMSRLSSSVHSQGNPARATPPPGTVSVCARNRATLCVRSPHHLLTLFMSPDWSPAPTHPRRPDGLLFDWWCVEGSLTRRLMAAGQDDFRVELLLQEHQPACPDEAAALGLDAGQPVWVREVLLHTAGAARVFARTVADLQAVIAGGVPLENLGSGSLGQLLFSDPRSQREPVEIG